MNPYDDIILWILACGYYMKDMIFACSEEGTGLNRSWSKGRIIRDNRIRGRDRVEPEVIEGEIIFHVDYVWHLVYHMIVYDTRYMDMIVMISELWMLIGMAPSICIWLFMISGICIWLLWHPVYECECLVFLHVWTQL